MTDLLERLRVFNGGINDYELWPKGLRAEAADEIERLRAQGDVLFASIKSNADEIERLRAALAETARMLTLEQLQQTTEGTIVVLVDLGLLTMGANE